MSLAPAPGTTSARPVGGAARSPNEMSSREAMGLPAGFSARGPLSPLDGQQDLVRLPPPLLAQVAGDPREPFDRRHAAGQLLALLGDPRIRPDDPQMVDIPRATVTLGLDPARVPAVLDTWSHVGVIEPWISKECPRYTVTIPDFRLMRYPVTNLEYRCFLEDTGLPYAPSGWRFGVYPAHAANHPVWTVTPEAADAYAAWLSKHTARRFRLPTEAEWEYAASGGDGRQYPWGEEFDPQAANTVESGPLSTTPVGIYPAGRCPFGADDLAGNVEEYVADDYAPYPGGEHVADDLVTGPDSYRIARGGSFTRYGDLARCARRHGWFDKPIYAIGFRLAEEQR